MNLALNGKFTSHKHLSVHTSGVLDARETSVAHSTSILLKSLFSTTRLDQGWMWLIEPC